MIPLTIKNSPEKGIGVFARHDFKKGEPVYHEMNNRSISLISLTNHSCEPNCDIKLLLVVARRDISRDEEITINYHDVGFTIQPMEFDCKCSSPHCIGHIKVGYELLRSKQQHRTTTTQ